MPAGAVGTIVIGLDDDELVTVETDGAPLGSAHNLGDGPVADRSLREGARTVVANGAQARELHEHAVDEWRVLTAGALVGLAGAALELGVEYAKQRHQFGVPIGSFQALAHGLADAATAVDGARAAGARGGAGRPTRARAGATALAAHGVPVRGPIGRSRRPAVALHVHGGYGFTLEYDIQLYLRRAKAWPLLLGDPPTGTRCTSPTRARSTDRWRAALMDFRLGERSDAFRDGGARVPARALPARDGRTRTRHRDRRTTGSSTGRSARRAGSRRRGPRSTAGRGATRSR